jgi:hypothetical protein
MYTGAPVSCLQLLRAADVIDVRVRDDNRG